MQVNARGEVEAPEAGPPDLRCSHAAAAYLLGIRTKGISWDTHTGGTTLFNTRAEVRDRLGAEQLVGNYIQYIMAPIVDGLSNHGSKYTSDTDIQNATRLVNTLGKDQDWCLPEDAGT